MKILIPLFISLTVGFVIWQIDSQPNWDDAGISAGAILISTGLISLIWNKHPLITALGVGIWIPLFGIINFGNYSTLLVFLFALIGAYGGASLRSSKKII